MTVELQPEKLRRLTRLTAQLLQLTDAAATHLTAACAWPQLVELGLDAVPSACHLDVSEASAGRRFHVVAADAEYPPELDTVRDTTHEGPCFDSLKTATPTACDDLTTDPRWPAYGPQVARHVGIRSVLSSRIRLADGRPGVLTLYSEWPQGFDDLAIITAGLLAACCTLSAAT